MILLADYLPSPSLMTAPVRAPLPASYGIPVQSFNQLAQAPMLSQALSNPFQSVMSPMSSATSKLVSRPKLLLRALDLHVITRLSTAPLHLQSPLLVVAG